MGKGTANKFANVFKIWIKINFKCLTFSNSQYIHYISYNNIIHIIIIQLKKWVKVKQAIKFANVSIIWIKINYKYLAFIFSQLMNYIS